MLLLISIFFIIRSPEVDNVVVHPQFETMLHSNAEIKASSKFPWLGGLFGILILCLFILFVLVGLDNKSEKLTRTGRLTFWIGGVIYLLAFVILLTVHWNYVRSGGVTFFAGFPLPTSILLYGLVTAPIYFTFLYILKFNQWIISVEDQKQFKNILEARKKADNNLKSKPSS